jgi:hypothetical protein
LQIGDFRLQIEKPGIFDLKSSILFHFLVRRVLAADAAELFQLQALRHSLPVLGGRIVPLFAIAALQGNDLSGHKHSS